MIHLSRTMKGWPVIFLLIVLAMGTPTVMAIDEVVDDYEDEDLVYFKDDVVRNSTFDVMELNFSGLAPSFEDFTGYTEVDVGADRIQVNSAVYVEHEALRTEDTYLYYDFGAGYFDDFTHDFDFSCDYDMPGSLGNPWTLSQTAINDVRGIFNTANEKALNVRLYRHTSQGNSISLSYYSGSGVTADTHGVYGAIVSSTLYYVRIVKSTNNINLGVYSTSLLRDAGDGTDGDITNLDIDMFGGYTFRYLFVANTWNDGSSPFNCNYDVYNFNIGGVAGGYATDGWFNTTNYLDGLSYNATVLLTNTSIPSGSINAEISGDGSAWTDLGTLASGYEAMDLRALGLVDGWLRFNFTRGDPSETPRLYQTRLVHEGPGAGGPGVAVAVDVYPYLAIGIALALAVLLIADRSRR